MDAKTKSETQKCARLKNAIKTCKAFLTEDILRATARREQLLKEKLNWLSEINTLCQKFKKFGMVIIKEGEKNETNSFLK